MELLGLMSGELGRGIDTLEDMNFTRLDREPPQEVRCPFS